MSQPQPFGRRGRPVASSAAGRGPEKAAVNLTPAVSPELLAAVVGRQSGLRAVVHTGLPDVSKVGWSFRAAVLAGLIVGLFNAAAQATSFLGFGASSPLDRLPLGHTPFGQISLGQAGMPLTVLIAIAGLWDGARASAFTLLFAHKILTRRGRTSFVAYSLGGAAASLIYALIAALLWTDATPLSISLDALSGLGAGFFYRLFAATERG